MELHRRDLCTVRKLLAGLWLHGDCRGAAGAVSIRSACWRTALLFGALEAGAGAMQRDAAVPSVVVSVVEAALILMVVAADRCSRAP